MKKDDKVVIIPGMTLYDMGISKLVSRTGTVTTVCNKGCWIELDGQEYKGHKEWFIPNSSLSQ